MIYVCLSIYIKSKILTVHVALKKMQHSTECLTTDLPVQWHSKYSLKRKKDSSAHGVYLSVKF